MNSSQGPGANGEGPSEWVDEVMELAAIYSATFTIKATATAESALRAHLEAKEREHLATKALVKQLAEALDMLTQEFVKVFPIYYYAEPWAHDQNAALKFARAALAAQQQHVATQEKK